jgi:hypothetical protein
MKLTKTESTFLSQTYFRISVPIPLNLAPTHFFFPYVSLSSHSPLPPPSFFPSEPSTRERACSLYACIHFFYPISLVYLIVKRTDWSPPLISICIHFRIHISNKYNKYAYTINILKCIKSIISIKNKRCLRI